METPLLAAALIVKNEEKFLPGCLEHLNALRPLISEICIYDTGSTDRTIEIAEDAGARVERGYWDDDFGRAKNAAVAMCHAKWVMVVDADERVVGSQSSFRQTLREGLSLDVTGLDAMTVQLAALKEDGTESFSMPALRVFRPSRCRFEGRIHEQPVMRQGGRAMRRADIPGSVIKWLHLGYVDEAMRGKGVRNLALAQEAMADSAGGENIAKQLLDRARSHMILGHHLPAVLDYLACWRLKTDDGLRLWAGQDLAQLLNNLGVYDDAAVIARELQEDGRQPQYADWMMARARQGQGAYREALDLYRRVDDPRNAAGITRGTADVLEGRMLMAAEVGELEEALACGVRLMAGHGRIAGRGRFLMALWADRDPEQLAKLLNETGPGRAQDLAAELAAVSAQGEAVARALRALAASTSAFYGGRIDLEGSSSERDVGESSGLDSAGR